MDVMIDSFFSHVHPIANHVHEVRFRQQWQSRKVPHSRSSFALLMAICATGARTCGNDGPQTVDGLQTYRQDAVAAVERASLGSRTTEDLQAVNLLALLGLELGDPAMLQHYLGLYHTLSAQQNLHDERRWPSMTDVEQEQMRRLFWHTYRLEVHTSIVMGHPVRCPELQCFVQYPAVPDQDTSHGSEDDMEWLAGWNFVTDLYRGLEHLVSKFRAQGFRVEHHSGTSPFVTQPLLGFDADAMILKPLTLSLKSLPPRFRKAYPISANIAQNRCGYQAANIICTYQV